MGRTTDTEERVVSTIRRLTTSTTYRPTAYEVASALVDEDVAAGEYEGCSVELEIAVTAYAAKAERALTTRRYVETLDVADLTPIERAAVEILATVFVVVENTGGCFDVLVPLAIDRGEKNR